MKVASREEDTMEQISNLRRLQLEEKNILDIFVQICEKHNLRYYLLGGTLLGAIRHEGFIPWDDDVDVCMPRSDYNTFLEIAEKELNEPYYLVGNHNNRDYRYCFARIANPQVKIKNNSANIPRVEDAWLDIIPLDGMPDGKVKLKIHKFKLFFWRSMNQLAQYDELVDQKRKRGAVETFLVKIAGCRIFRSLVDYRKCIANVQKELSKYAYDDYDVIINYMAAYGFKETFLKEWFADGAKYPFENSTYVGPKNYDAVLKTIYNDTYMELPPEEDRNKHNAEIIQV